MQPTTVMADLPGITRHLITMGHVMTGTSTIAAETAAIEAETGKIVAPPETQPTGEHC